MHITPQPKPAINQIWSSSSYVLGDKMCQRYFVVVETGAARVTLARCNIDGAIFGHAKRRFYRKQSIKLTQFSGRANAFTYIRMSRYEAPTFIPWDGG